MSLVATKHGWCRQRHHLQLVDIFSAGFAGDHNVLGLNTYFCSWPALKLFRFLFQVLPPAESSATTAAAVKVLGGGGGEGGRGEVGGESGGMKSGCVNRHRRHRAAAMVDATASPLLPPPI